jgi:hypothetical protein
VAEHKDIGVKRVKTRAKVRKVNPGFRFRELRLPFFFLRAISGCVYDATSRAENGEEISLLTVVSFFLTW